ncbi:hypothetical protein QL285_037118 [Trifolium repens]|nr:hypothetical protein QL285_037118 [Trifolium repens]
MAENASSAEQVDKVSIRVLVEKGKNKVLYAEAGKDFVDVLFSFFTLPLGTIARLVAKDDDSNIKAVKFGSISSLYQSVSDLDQQYLWSKTCKEMLLKPKNSRGNRCKNMKLNIDDTEPLMSYFLCQRDKCKVENCASYYRNQTCIACRGPLDRVKTMNLTEQIGFVKPTSTFIVSDDLFVMPNIIGTSLNLLKKHEINSFDTIDKQIIIDLLKLSLVSKTPLSDFILKKEQNVYNLDTRNRLGVLSGEEKEQSDKMVVKVVRRKSNEQILFVEAEQDFADFIFSFLTFPLGGVLHMLQGFSFLCCIDNLYNTMTELSPDRYFVSQEVKNIPTNPSISRQLELRNQLLPIPNENYKEINKSFKFVDPKSPITGGFAIAQTFMVTDDLVVTPMSSIDGISFIERMNAPLNDVEEIVINIGQKEGLSILEASLSSTSVLTNGLKQYIGSGAADQADISADASLTVNPLKKPKEENEA